MAEWQFIVSEPVPYSSSDMLRLREAQKAAANKSKSTMDMLRFREAQAIVYLKGKAVTGDILRFRDEQTSILLKGRINEVIGCDKPCPDFDPLRPDKGTNIYYVSVWVNSHSVYETPWVSAKNPNHPYLTWSSPTSVPEIFGLELNPETYESEELKLEVIRSGCYGEIGTSNGNVVVGRATIKLSKISKEAPRCYRVDLVRPMMDCSECRIEGKIIMDMKVESIISRPRPERY